jgi:N6-L-threonylcarbamoyladenine synthase
MVATQHELHQRYAGVVPEIASRAHLERITPVIREALAIASVKHDQLDAVAVGHRPGLIGSLLVGVSAAKALAWSLGVPLIGVDHIAAHLHACCLDDAPIEFPAIGIVVSGGHTSLFHLSSSLKIRLLGRTIDDAVGEAYDKAATILGLGYPGGPALDALAQHGDDRAMELPIAFLPEQRLSFSFSGLKTALLYAACGQPTGRGDSTRFVRTAVHLSERRKADLAASFQRAAVTALLRNLKRALEEFEVRSVLVGGGVSANSRFRRELVQLREERGIAVRVPRLEYCLDNAAMIAGYAHERLIAGESDPWSLSAATSSSIGA